MKEKYKHVHVYRQQLPSYVAMYVMVSIKLIEAEY